MAGLERRLIVKRLKDGRRAKAKAGGRSAGRYPYGWDKDGPIQSEQGVLLLIREFRAEGNTRKQVASLLNTRGHRPRTART